MERFQFIQETSQRHKRRVVFTTFVICLILLGATIAFGATVYTWLGTSNPLTSTIVHEIHSLSSVGLFYAGFVGGLFFVPIPQEAFFYWGLLKGNSIVLSLIFINAGFLLSQVVNYFVGWKLNKVVIHLVSKKSLYKSRRFVNRYGGLGVLVFNTLPLPAPLLTFGLGIARYNVYRLFLYMIIGTAIKYAAIIGFFFLVR